MIGFPQNRISMETEFLFQALIYLAAAVVFVPIAKKLGMSSILGYLLAGIIIGPFVIGLIGQESHDIMRFAEFGIVMMLFLIGLEMEPGKFWKMRKIFLGMGSMQLFGTILILFMGCFLFMDWNWKTTLAISSTLALSSSAIVLQSLSEKGLRNTAVGQSSFAVLLFQDIAVIPILVFLPILATSIPATTNDIHQSLISSFPGWIQAVIIVGIISLIYFGGRFLFVLLFKIIAKTRLQELFTASALLLVVSISCLMQLIGISPALGTFLSGVVLANSEFRHELEGDIAPFKGLLLGLFFIGVGASINFKLVLENPLFILVFGAILTLVKFTVSYLISRFYKKKTEENMLFALGLSQSGEFGFVIMSFCMQLNIVPTILANQIIAIIAMSMVSTPFLQFINGLTEGNDRIVFIATTNYLEHLDDAIKNRPMRFNRKFEFKYPNNDQINKLITLYFDKKTSDKYSTTCYNKNFTGAHIKEIKRTATILSVKDNTDIDSVFEKSVKLVYDNFSITLRNKPGF